MPAAFAPGDETAHRRGRTRPRYAWRLLALGVLLVGVVASALSGRWWGNQVRADQDEAFAARAESLRHTVASLILRAVDVTGGALALKEIGVDLDATQFQQWFDRVSAHDRYPGVKVIGYTEFVPAADALGAAARITEWFLTRMAAVPPEILARLDANFDATLDPTQDVYS